MLAVSYILTDNADKAQYLLLNYLKSNRTHLNDDIAANIYHNLGRTYMLKGNANEALKYLMKSKDLQMSIYGKVSDKTQQYITECLSK